MWKGLLVGLLFLLTLAFLPPKAHADGPVYVSPDWPGGMALQARLEHQLRPGDGIVVHILLGNDEPIPHHTIVITAADGQLPHQVSVIADDGWLDQVTAEDLLQRAMNIATDPIDQIVMFIRSIHAWQDTHPRPIPPVPPQPPDYTWVWWAGGIAAGLLLVWLIAWRVRVKGRIEAGLSQRADDPDYWKDVLQSLNKQVGE